MARPLVPSIAVMQGDQTAREWVRFFTLLVRRSKAPPVTPAVGASPAAFTAPDDGTYYIVGGTVTDVNLARGTWSASIGANANPVRVLVGDVLTITYSVAPVVQFVAN